MVCCTSRRHSAWIYRMHKEYILHPYVYRNRSTINNNEDPNFMGALKCARSKNRFSYVMIRLTRFEQAEGVRIVFGVQACLRNGMILAHSTSDMDPREAQDGLCGRNSDATYSCELIRYTQTLTHH